MQEWCKRTRGQTALWLDLPPYQLRWLYKKRSAVAPELKPDCDIIARPGAELFAFRRLEVEPRLDPRLAGEAGTPGS
jgi:hypothetical protein